jgi:hypothetical protein
MRGDVHSFDLSRAIAQQAQGTTAGRVAAWIAGDQEYADGFGGWRLGLLIGHV